MRLLVTAFVLFAGGILLLASEDAAKCNEPTSDAVESELSKLQGLWQTSTGGMEHQDGHQVVQNPMLDGPCFFIRGDSLIWLDEEGKPTGKEETIRSPHSSRS